VWRPWSYSIRFKSLPPVEEVLPVSRPGGPTRQGVTFQEKDIGTQYTSTSSFYALATPIHDNYKYTYPTQPLPAHTKPQSISWADQSRDIAGPAYILQKKMDSIPESPSFIYSVADSIYTYRSSANLLPVASHGNLPLSPSSTHTAPWRPNHPPPLVLASTTRARDDTDNASMESRYSDMSGVTSVFATRHSIDSSLQTLSPSTRAACSDEMADKKIVFSGDRADDWGLSESTRNKVANRLRLDADRSADPQSGTRSGMPESAFATQTGDLYQNVGRRRRGGVI
jgi:hypothetical protein